MAVTQQRYRYIGFTLQSKNTCIFDRKTMIITIKSTCQHLFHTHPKTYGFFLTRFKDNKGILRCHHTEKQKAITLLTSITTIQSYDVTIETIGTSGTIKTLIKKYFHGDPLKDRLMVKKT